MNRQTLAGRESAKGVSLFTWQWHCWMSVLKRLADESDVNILIPPVLTVYLHEKGRNSSRRLKDIQKTMPIDRLVLRIWRATVKPIIVNSDCL